VDSAERWLRAGERLGAALARRVRPLAARLLPPGADGSPAALSALQPGLHGRTVLITGSTRGVGWELARACGRAGARVVLNGRDARRVEAAVERLGECAPAASGLAADVSTEDGARRLIDFAVERTGGLDALVNNAAVLGPPGAPAWAIAPAAWDEVLQTNLRGAFLCAREALRWMAEHAVAGRIVNISSGAGRMAVPGLAPYVASKHALEGLTRALAQDAEVLGVAMCAVELGPLRTRLARQSARLEDYVQLPGPETVTPLLLHALGAPASAVHDRIFAAWRYAQDGAAEAALARPGAALAKPAFAPAVHRGAPLRRSDPGVRAYDRAENPLGMSPRAREALAACAGVLDASRYPDENYPRLRRALADQLQLPPQRFSFAAGSAELVERSVRLFAGPGDEVVSNDPTWFMFDRFCANAEVASRKIRARQRELDGAFDAELGQMAERVSARTRLVYLVHPSNPLGNGLRHADFLEFLAAIPPSVPVVVDEAYIEFSDEPALLRSHEIAAQSERALICLRTFSKFYALAGLRIGYAFGTAAGMALFERLEQLFSVSTLAEEAALAALGDAEHARATRELLRGEKLRLRGALADLGLASVPSQTHFMLVQCPRPAGEAERVYEAFADAGLLLPRGLVGGRYLVLPVLRPEQNDQHLAILASARRAVPGRA
jgi:histidinol-phosphate aminotransferase